MEYRCAWPLPNRRLHLLLAVMAAVGTLAGLSHGAADPAAACQASKLHHAGRYVRAVLSCYSLAAADKTPVDAACGSTAETRLSHSFARAEGEGGCTTRRDAAAVRQAVDHVAGALGNALRPDAPGSACSATKLSAAGEYLSRTLELYAKQRIYRNDGRLSQGDSYNAVRFYRAFEKADAEQCETTKDSLIVLARLEDLTGDLVETLWPLSALGVSFDRPVGWHLNPFFLVAGGYVELNNFSNAYIHGGIIPPGGAVIDVGEDDSPTPSLTTLAKGEARQEDAVIDSTLDVLVSGASALEVFKHHTFREDGDLKMIDIYVLHRPVRYRLRLHCWSDDPVDHVKTFEAFWRSVRFADRP